MQSEVLEKNPEAALQVIAVWFNMLRSDDRSHWPPGLLSDPRVTHFWDSEQVVGTWYGENVTAREQGHVEWDMFFVYDRQVVWSEDPPDHSASGRTIFGQRYELSRAARRSIDATDPP